MPRLHDPRVAIAGRVAIAVLVATLAAGASAGGLDVGASTGLPRVGGTTAGNAPWRYVSVRAENTDFETAVRIADCLPFPVATPTMAGAAESRCGAGTATTGAALSGYQWSAIWKAPQLGTGGPLIDVALQRTTGAATHDDGLPRRARSATEITLTQPLAAPIDLFAGYSLPITPRAYRTDTQTLFAGVSWRPHAGASLELYAEFDRSERGPLREALYGARYALATAAGARLVVFAHRFPGDADNRWQSGLGFEYAF
jgi:hypothetical protein